MFKETELANKKYELIQIDETTKIHQIFFFFCGPQWFYSYSLFKAQSHHENYFLFLIITFKRNQNLVHKSEIIIQ